MIASSTHRSTSTAPRRCARSGAHLVFEVHDLWPLTPIELGGMSPAHPFIRLMARAERDACASADTVVSILPAADRHLVTRGMPPERYVHVPNGISIADADAGEPLPDEQAELVRSLRADGRFLVGYAGGIGRVNAIDDLLAAATLLRTAPVTFMIWGDGPERPALERRAAEAGLTHLRFLGRIPKQSVRDALVRCDALYLGWKRSSVYRFGVSPNKLFDYMAAARPIVHATSAPLDLVAEYGCGVSVEAENPAALARAIEQIASLPAAERSELGARGRRQAEEQHDYRSSRPVCSMPSHGRNRLRARRWESDLRGRRLRLRACLTPVLVGLLAAACSLGATSRPAAGIKSEWIGPRVGADALANTRIGGPYGTTLAFRFRPTWSGSVTGVRFYIVVNSGGVGEYSGGDGGILRVSLMASDDGGLPAADALASTELRPQTDAISFPFARFDSPPQVVAGRSYYVVFTNTSPNPTENWVSVNALVGSAAGPAPPNPVRRCVARRLEGWRQLRRTGVPELRGRRRLHADHRRRGRTGRAAPRRRLHGVMDLQSKPIGGSAAVRELFTYRGSGRARVLRALVRVRRTGGSGRAAQRQTRGSAREDAGHVERPGNTSAERRAGLGVDDVPPPAGSEAGAEARLRAAFARRSVRDVPAARRDRLRLHRQHRVRLGLCAVLQLGQLDGLGSVGRFEP